MVIKCPNCNHYVSDTASVCPKCGASMTVSTPKNLANDVTDTNNHSESPKTFNSNIEVFPELAQYLRQHMILQKENPDMRYRTVIDDGLVSIFSKGNCYWDDDQPIRLGGYDNGFCLYLDFYIYADEEDEENKEENKIENDRIQRFRSLASFSQFIPHKTYFDGDCHREYAIDLGDDIDIASQIISEILQKVYLLPLSEELVINTEIDEEDDDNEDDVAENQEMNEEREDSYENVENPYEDVEDSAGILMNILCFLIPIVGLVLYFVKKSDYPNTAKSYLTWAAAGFGVSILINIIL